MSLIQLKFSSLAMKVGLVVKHFNVKFNWQEDENSKSTKSNATKFSRKLKGNITNKN